MSLQHVALETDPGVVVAEVAFWGLVGFTPVETPPGLRERATWLQHDGTQVHLLHAEDPVAPPKGHVAVVCRDYADALDRLRAAGHEPADRMPYWGAARAFVRTPGGHRVEVMAAAPA